AIQRVRHLLRNVSIEAGMRETCRCHPVLSSPRSSCDGRYPVLLGQGLFCGRDPRAHRCLSLNDLKGCAVVDFLARAAVAERFVRSFENLDHPQARPPVALWTRAGADAVDEMHEFDPQWLATGYGRNRDAPVVVGQLAIGDIPG